MTNKTIIVASICIVLAVAALMFLNNPISKINQQTSESASSQNVIVKNGTQYITIAARGGYSPTKTIAKAGIPTKLMVKTNGTFDCSSYLVVRALSYQKMLPQTGETEIDAGTPKPGDVVQGTCGMGMYNFSIVFH